MVAKLLVEVEIVVHVVINWIRLRRSRVIFTCGGSEAKRSDAGKDAETFQERAPFEVFGFYVVFGDGRLSI